MTNKIHYGGIEEALEFHRAVDERFGTHRGARLVAIKALGLGTRRILNLYMTGERAIPDKVWVRLNQPETDMWGEEVDPLS